MSVAGASLSAGAIRVMNPRQEPCAVVPLAGICAGGVGQPAFLPRPVQATEITEDTEDTERDAVLHIFNVSPER